MFVMFALLFLVLVLHTMSSSDGVHLRGGVRRLFQVIHLRDRSRSPAVERPMVGASSSSSRGARQRFSAEVMEHASSSGVPEHQVFRDNVARLHLSSKISAKELQCLSASASNAGAGGVQDFSQAGKRGELPGNTQRDVMRKMLKSCRMPEPYFADVPTHDPRTKTNGVMVSLPFLLVHEMVCSMCEKGLHVLDDLTSVPESIGK